MLRLYSMDSTYRDVQGFSRDAGSPIIAVRDPGLYFLRDPGKDEKNYP